MPRPFRTFVGIDLGGARGKSTAVARLTLGAGGYAEGASIEQVGTRDSARSPWYDDTLIAYLQSLPEDSVVAIDAPLTLPACIRCAVPACPGLSACVDPAVIWLANQGLDMVLAAAADDRDRIAAVPSATGAQAVAEVHTAHRSRPLLSPYTHRPAAVYLRHGRQFKTRETLGQGSGPITARASHLRRRLSACGFELNRNLIEVSPSATVHALFGPRRARGYKRDADPWNTRAAIIERLSSSLRFAPRSGFSREQVLRNDHCFEAVIAGYTAFLWARDDWQIPPEHAELCQTDGWIWAPPDR